ncbi:enoyl-CoA hydratase-related protein [Novosphingobium sp. fls2-241-R2A-195]|jgi:crotonobetainyl-CoA hydratase|uniref:enoyl-CoA hydratase/isomerase family protein n=1 Tax=Novosphingobium sp. fls2-241-R2A-195 TaxID=3040296 RepID=UPI002549CE32|nr:enoyl-CoA hydratase-related protein [Novosphingobium sp. fls2-241-R2A-195]
MAQVELFIEGRTARVHLNRPDARNALTFGMDVLLSRFWRQVDEDPEIWTVVLTAQGDEAFCIGADMSEARPAAPRPAVGGGLTGIGGPLVPLSKPLVAAVQGFCVGAGFELAMCADVIVAAENAQFGLPETRRGIIGECGVVHRAVRRLPHHVAMAMILTGERIDARAAERFGLVNQLVPLAGLSDAAMDWAARINKASPLANRAAKAAVAKGLALPLEAALGSRFEEIESYAGSDDARERDAAIVQGRMPVWTGR